MTARALLVIALVAAPFAALAQPAASIFDYDTGVSIVPDSSITFSDTFQPYQAHIFAIAKP